MSRPFFVSLDGLDGAGKSTQCRLLTDWLREQGRAVVDCVDPGGTEVGVVLRDLLLHERGQLSLPCEALLFMASRAQLVAEVIRPALDAGQCVVSDRFLLANVVYQGHAGGLNPEDLWRVGRVATQGLEPDLTFVLDLPLERATARRKPSSDRLESRHTEYHLKVRQGFLEEAKLHPEKIVVLDAVHSAEEIQSEIRSRCQVLLS